MPSRPMTWDAEEAETPQSLNMARIGFTREHRLRHRPSGPPAHNLRRQAAPCERAAVGVDLEVLDAMTGLPVELVKRRALVAAPLSLVR
jgi:hypothetical protein